MSEIEIQSVKKKCGRKYSGRTLEKKTVKNRLITVDSSDEEL
jgi:hypothetical protein